LRRDRNPDRRERDDRQELDRRDGREREAVDREVEPHVHHREHRAPAQDQRVGQPRERPPPRREHGRRGGDPQPGDAERVDPGEQQHRERRAEVVEDGGDEEVAVRRHHAEPQRAGAFGGMGDRRKIRAEPLDSKVDRR
jgi:hypothetical protein